MRDLLRDDFFIKMVNNPDANTKHYWQRWLERHPERKEDFELAMQTIQSIKYKKTKKLSEADYDRMFLQIRAFKQLQDEKEKDTLPKNRRLYPYMVGVAAVILFLITISFGVVYYIPENIPDPVSSNEELIEKNVPFGAKNTIKLGDGSVIRLNAGSQLKFPKQFANDIRTVELVGEAFFDVAKDENRPFIIKTGEVSTQVLGTSFNLRHYDDEENIEVALITGNVKVNDAHGNVILLKPSEMAVYSKNNKTIQKKSFNVRLVTSWKDNILVFEKATMKQITNKLEQWYGVKINTDLNSPIIGLYNGEFKDEPLYMVLEGIGFASGFQFSIDVNNVTIKN